MKSKNNVLVKGVEIELDKKRTMVFDLNALCELEEAYGSVNKAFEELENSSVKAIRKLLHAALMHEDEELTEIEVGKMLTIHNMNDIVVKISEALTISYPEVDDGESKN